MEPSPLVSIVVPSWNGRRHLETLLPALAAQTCRDFETLVVDNGSSDGSAELVAAAGGTTLLPLGRNLGFAAAVNRGVARARGDLILLLNNDMEPRPAFLAALVAAAARAPAVGSFACRVLRRDDPTRIDSAGDRLLRSGRSRGIGRGEPDGPAFAASRPVFAGTGGAVLYRRQVLDQVGPLDEDFFLYVEDTDLALRAQLAGWTCQYVPEAVTLHTGGGSMRGREDERARYCLRNHIYLLLKDYPGRLLLRHAGAVAEGVAAEVAFSFAASRARHGGARALLLVALTLGDALRRAPRMLARRRRLRRTVPLERIEALLE